MRRSASRKTLLGIALFPFLAVLICTMGALIVLLILVVQQARVNAETLADRARQAQDVAPSAQQLQMQQEVEDLQWKRDVLEQQRGELTEKLSDGNSELSHLEDHIRRLEEKWRRLRAEAAEWKKVQQGELQQGSSAPEELSRLQAELTAQRQQLEQLRKQAAEKSRSFAIIPYQGPAGTRRRPIYIECRESGIVIQPEGIVFGPRDLSGPLGPGNPLDAALRAIREHWTRLEGDAAQGAAYPLLVVRPDGAVAYSMARAAMAGWDDEFGYELVDGEMSLTYPASDPKLKRVLQETIQNARERQAMLAAAMPSRFDAPSPTSFAVPQGEAWGGMEGDPRSGLDGDRPRGASALGSGKATESAAGYGGGGVSRPPADPSTAADLASYSPPGKSDAAAGPSPASRPGSSAKPAPTQPGGTAGSPAEGQARGAALPSIAATKGANWALRDRTATATGITRPITIHCYPDRLVVMPDRRDTLDPQTVPMEGSTRDSMEAFAAAIWTHTERWGMAVAGGYWKPKLKVTVFPGAETRFWELQALLADSGFDVERR